MDLNRRDFMVASGALLTGLSIPRGCIACPPKVEQTAVEQQVYVSNGRPMFEGKLSVIVDYRRGKEIDTGRIKRTLPPQKLAWWGERQFGREAVEALDQIAKDCNTLGDAYWFTSIGMQFWLSEKTEHACRFVMDYFPKAECREVFSRYAHNLPFGMLTGAWPSTLRVTWAPPLNYESWGTHNHTRPFTPVYQRVPPESERIPYQ